MTGYTPDGALLRGLGVQFDPETGIPRHDPDTMETNVRGVFIAGVITAGFNANKVFIENGRDHGSRIVAAIHASLDRARAGGAQDGG
jgi:thioredoxin reductase (NADPH)